MEDTLQAPVVRQDHVISVQCRCMQITNWAAGTHVTCGIDPGPDRSGQVLTLHFLLTYLTEACETELSKGLAGFCPTMGTRHLEIWLLVALIGIVTL
jgi:hypothetical protein